MIFVIEIDGGEIKIQDGDGNFIASVDDAGSRRLLTQVKGEAKIQDKDGNYLDSSLASGLRSLLVKLSDDTGSAGVVKAVLIDGVNGLELAVVDDTPVPTNTRSLLTSGIDSTGKAQRISALAEGSNHRLMVDAREVLISTATLIEFVKNGGSEDLRVDGGTPVTFVLNADPTLDIVLTNIVFCMSTSSVDLDGDSFASGNALTTGVKCQATVNDGVVVNIALFKLNEDFRRLLGASLAQGGVNDNMTGTITFGGRMVLKAGTSDKVEVTVQDDLTNALLGLKYLTATVYGLKE